MTNLEIQLPRLSLVVLVGVSGAGKSTFAARHFLPTEVVSSDQCRALASDDENDLSATPAAFEILNFIAAKRLEAGKLTVIDATNVQARDRRPLVALAREYHALPVAIVLDLPEKRCLERNRDRTDRTLEKRVIKRQSEQLRRGKKDLKREGFKQVWKIRSQEEAENAAVLRVPLWNDKRHLPGPFDIIGDIHGCSRELKTLLEALGYRICGYTAAGPMAGPVFAHPKGRMAVFLGDLVDRGTGIVETLRLVHNMVTAGHALCVPGNHDIRLQRKLSGQKVRVAYGLAESLQEIDALSEDVRPDFINTVKIFLRKLVSHYVLDDGNLVAAHAGLPEQMQGRGSARVRDFCLFGETTGETDAFGLPVRNNWAAQYRGKAVVVYGHTPVMAPEWLNRTINVDTGCVFGGRLSALRYPENEIVSVPAERVYCEPLKPLNGNGLGAFRPGAQQKNDDLLDAEDVMGKRQIQTRLYRNVTIREEQAMAALEILSRFAVDPRWLIYLPPTMSPIETSLREAILEHPDEGFAYYRNQGISRVICQEKHMGSRAIVVIAQSPEAAAAHFGVKEDCAGMIYTRTGRRFFADLQMETAVLDRLRKALSGADFWNIFSTKWVCLDCEIMPWSEKALDLIRSQYAAVGCAARMSLKAAIDVLKTALGRTDLQKDVSALPGSAGVDVDLASLLEKTETREQSVSAYIKAYRQYCRPVQTVTDLKIAPFHVLATEGQVHADKTHEWHIKTIEALCAADEMLLQSTVSRIVNPADEADIKSACGWWESLTDAGGEGMVIKPLDFAARGKRGIVQPALKCRGREYLRIIYGPEYAEPEHLGRLRQRSLGVKRSLALREFALGIEALERFVRKEPLRRVHECVFGVLALESETVDPRL